VNLVNSSQKSIDSDKQGVDQGTSSSIRVLVQCVGDDSYEVVLMETH
jgi:hypothetical protein